MKFCFTLVHIAEGIHVTFSLVLFSSVDPCFSPSGCNLSLGLFSEDVFPFSDDVLYVKILNARFNLLLLM